MSLAAITLGGGPKRKVNQLPREGERYVVIPQDVDGWQFPGHTAELNGRPLPVARGLPGQSQPVLLEARCCSRRCARGAPAFVRTASSRSVPGASVAAGRYEAHGPAWSCSASGSRHGLVARWCCVTLILTDTLAPHATSQPVGIVLKHY